MFFFILKNKITLIINILKKNAIFANWNFD